MLKKMQATSKEMRPKTSLVGFVRVGTVPRFAKRVSVSLLVRARAPLGGKVRPDHKGERAETGHLTSKVLRGANAKKCKEIQ